MKSCLSVLAFLSASMGLATAGERYIARRLVLG